MRIFFFLVTIWASASFADEQMTVEFWPYESDGNYEQLPTIYLEGPVDYDVDIRLAAALAEHPETRIILLGPSPGGSLYGGIKTAEVIYESGLPLRVTGPVASAAAIMATGGSEIVGFYDEEVDIESEILFHCAYLRGEDICDAAATQDAARLLGRFTSPSETWWFDFLMQHTTPSSVSQIPMQELLSNWNCSYSNTITWCQKPRQVTILRNSDISGNDIWLNGLKDVSFDECIQECQAIFHCVGVSYIRERNWCWIKDQADNILLNEEVDSATLSDLSASGSN